MLPIWIDNNMTNITKTQKALFTIVVFALGGLTFASGMNDAHAETLLIDDDFATDLNGWIYSSFCNSCAVVPVPTDNYSLTLDNSDGQSLPSALISGEGYAITSGMEKSVILPDDVTKVILSFDGKAHGTLPSHVNIPNLQLKIFDTNDVSLYGELMIGYTNPSSDPTTNWQSFEIDITDYVINQNDITVFLGLNDSWNVNVSYDQKVWIDNVQLLVETSSLYCNQPESYYNVINGTNSSDYLMGTKLSDLIFGNGGDDFIRGAAGNDCIFGGEGNDFIQGGNGDDTIYAGNGDDKVRTGPGNDTVHGEDGDDVLLGVSGKGTNTLDGGSGSDMCVPQGSKVILNSTNCEITAPTN